MKHMRPLNKKAARIDNYVASRTGDDVVGLQNPPAPQRPHVPMSLDAAEGVLGLEHAGGGPAVDHRGVFPLRHLAGGRFSANRFAILYRIGNAKKPETRSRRIDQFCRDVGPR